MPINLKHIAPPVFSVMLYKQLSYGLALTQNKSFGYVISDQSIVRRNAVLLSVLGTMCEYMSLDSLLIDIR